MQVSIHSACCTYLVYNCMRSAKVGKCNGRNYFAQKEILSFLCIALHMQKWTHSIVVLLAALLLVAGHPALLERVGALHVQGHPPLAYQGDNADERQLMQPEAPVLQALPADAGTTELRSSPQRILEPQRHTFSVWAKTNQQRQYLYHAAILLPNLPSWHIAYPFLAFW